MLAWLLGLIAILIWYFLKRNYEYWKRKGVPGPKPTYIVGNIKDNFLRKKPFNEICRDIYKDYKDLAFVGIYRAGTPCLLIRDPQMVKEIAVKSFKSFHDNDLYVDKEVDPLFGRNPFVLHGEEWHTTRKQLTPCFTTGKMKFVCPFVEEVAKGAVQYLDKLSGGKSVCLEAKELCTKFTLDSVATCAFGIEGNCFEDPEAEFRSLATRFISPGSWAGVKFALAVVIPKLSQRLKLKLVEAQVEERLRQIVNSTIKYREENNILRPDFLHMIYELKKSLNSPNFTMEDVTAHAASFFIDGFETSSIVMSFVLYELAKSPQAQEILRDQINNIYENHSGFRYEAFQEMEYLDACINETLRLNPPLPVFGKLCTESFKYSVKENSEFKPMSVNIEKGTTIIIPVDAIHLDSKYHPTPHLFNPERFLTENKESFNKDAFLPFGEGPRACLGQRFGFLQVKIGIAYIIKHYELKLNQRTKSPLKFDPWYFMLSPIGGLWINFIKIH